MGHYQHSEKNESKLIYSQYIICAVHTYVQWLLSLATKGAISKSTSESISMLPNLTFKT